MQNPAGPFLMSFYLKFHYVPGSEMARMYPNDTYYAGFYTRAEAKQHRIDAQEREDVVYEGKIYTKAELNN